MLHATPLREIIGTKREPAVISAVEEFSCRDKDVENFLKNKAFEFEKRDKSRTYFIFDDKEFSAGNISILAYFTISLKNLDFDDTLSKSKIKEIDGFSKDVKGIALVLIGQFGKDEHKAGDVPGKKLLNVCMKKIIQIQQLAGGRYVLIECRDLEKVVGFYENNGFSLLQVDKSDSYLQMVRRI